MNAASINLKVADETWIAAAMLHRGHPDRSDFSVEEIVEQARTENIFGHLRPGVYVHANTHCVANRAPNPGAYRMLYETAPGRRRLFREGDEAHPKRRGKVTPERDEIPEPYHYLLDWYETEYAPAVPKNRFAALYEAFGSGRDLWKDEDPDAYVRRLREGWE